MRLKSLFFTVLIGILISSSIIPAIAQENSEVLTVYSGRSESLIGPLLEQFTADTGVQVEVLYGSTSGIASQILEEGQNTPADVVITQDAGALGALAKAGLLDTLPQDIMARSIPELSSPNNEWVGLSGRARVLVYNPELLEEAGVGLPESILDLTDPRYNGLVGWAPTNGSFQANVTAMRELLGDEATQEWLQNMVANGSIPFEGNTPLNQAVIDGEVVMGITNHYYMFRFLADNPDLPIEQFFFPGGDPGSLINVAGAAVLEPSQQPGLAQRFVLYMLGQNAQQYFADETFEYPVVDAIETNERLTPLDSIEAPALDLSDIDDLQGTIDLIEDSGALDG